MRTAISVIITLSSIYAIAADWISYSYENRTKSITSCGKENKSPADYMKHFDELTMPYKVTNEQRDKGNALNAITIVKNPEKVSEASLYFFKSKADCEKSFKLLQDKVEKETAAEAGAEASKYDSYK